MMLCRCRVNCYSLTIIKCGKKISLVLSTSRTFVSLIESTSHTNSVSLILLSPCLRNSLKSLGILDLCDRTKILLETLRLFLSYNLSDVSWYVLQTMSIRLYLKGSIFTSFHAKSSYVSGISVIVLTIAMKSTTKAPTLSFVVGFL